MTVVVVDAYDASDPALVNSHWVAERTAHRLGPVARSLLGDAVTRTQVAQHLADASVTGMVYCGHGSADALCYAGNAVFDLLNLVTIGPRWFHAFACNSGNSLALTAPREGVDAYLGYNRPVVVEWSVEQLPEALAAVLEDIVTAATMRLHQGVRSRRDLANAVEAAYDAWIAWRLSHEDEPLPLNEQLGMNELRRLFECMELHGQRVTD